MTALQSHDFKSQGPDFTTYTIGYSSLTDLTKNLSRHDALLFSKLIQNLNTAQNTLDSKIKDIPRIQTNFNTLMLSLYFRNETLEGTFALNHTTFNKHSTLKNFSYTTSFVHQTEILAHKLQEAYDTSKDWTLKYFPTWTLFIPQTEKKLERDPKIRYFEPETTFTIKAPTEALSYKADLWTHWADHPSDTLSHIPVKERIQDMLACRRVIYKQ
jgi:hypothetical protein